MVAGDPDDGGEEGPAGSAQANASAYSDRRRKAALLVVALAFVMDLMDATILAIALLTIQRTMHASDTAMHWIAAGYTLAFAGTWVTGSCSRSCCACTATSFAKPAAPRPASSGRSASADC
jgi:hypothetical protein